MANATTTTTDTRPAGFAPTEAYREGYFHGAEGRYADPARMTGEADFAAGYFHGRTDREGRS